MADGPTPAANRGDRRQRNMSPPPPSQPPPRPYPDGSKPQSLAAAAAAAVAVVLSRGLPEAISTPVTLLSLLCLVLWLSPVGLAFVVQVLLTELFRLSPLLADDVEEDDGGGAGLGAGLGWEAVRGRVAVREWEWQRQQQQQGQQQEPPPSVPPTERKRKREPRVAVEWEAGQMFLVIRRPVASEWLINLVNRCDIARVPGDAGRDNFPGRREGLLPWVTGAD